MCLIGIRGTAYGREDWDFAAANGIRIIPIAEFHARGPEDVMAEAREIVGQGPTYVTYDIDFVDPTFAPGTGTPEVGGPTVWQALQVARGLAGAGCRRGGPGGGVAAVRSSRAGRPGWGSA